MPKKLKTHHFVDRKESPLDENLLSKRSVEVLRAYHDNSRPYRHVVIDPLCTPEKIRQIHDEAIYNITTTFKETDLFKVYQSGDLAAISTSDNHTKLPHLLSLRTALYSKEFREFVQNITGCDELTDRVDCSTNAYATGGHLLCHDDVIGTRRISYVIYFSDPDDPWAASDGGALELYPLDLSSAIDRPIEEGGVQGVPEVIPTLRILPKCNTMALFVVQPGRSYHSVQEVFSSTRPRLSISGWYHGPTPPVGSDLASLRQIMTTGDDANPFLPLPSPKKAKLTEKDIKKLSFYINPLYLTETSMRQINKRFCRDSSVQLKQFLRVELEDEILKRMIDSDEKEKLGSGQVPYDHSGLSERGWSLVGPPHKRRYLRFQPSSDDREDSTGKILQSVRSALFRSKVFVKYLQILTSLSPIGSREEIRRFRPGLDYTVAYFGAMTQVPRLDATLCFVRERADDDSWESGDVGGFECYIESSETSDTAEAAEVYRAKDEEDEESLLSVSPSHNVLSLVMRDQNVMRFVKYVSINALSSRWDISAEYELHPDSTEDQDDDDDEVDPF